jgi:hypothetical protein
LPMAGPVCVVVLVSAVWLRLGLFAGLVVVALFAWKCFDQDTLDPYALAAEQSSLTWTYVTFA